jgi:hypothetical protein
VDVVWEQFFCCLLHAYEATSDLLEKIDIHIDIVRKACNGKKQDVIVAHADFPLSLLEGIQSGERVVHTQALRSNSVEESFGCLKLALQLRELAPPPCGRRYNDASICRTSVTMQSTAAEDAIQPSSNVSSEPGPDAEGGPPARTRRSVAEGEWIPDAEVSSCARCNQAFSLTFRRHHCRNCGDVVCYICSENRAILPKINLTTPQRICVACNYELVERHQHKLAIMAEMKAGNQ